MPNYLLKKDTLNLEPLEFEDLSGDRPRILRALPQEEPEEAPAAVPAHKIIRRDSMRELGEIVDIFSTSLLDEDDETEEPVGAEEDDLYQTGLDPAELEAILAERDADWQLRLDAAIESARAEGYDRGFEEARGQLEAGFDKTKVDFVQALAKLQGTWEGFIQRSEALLLEIALEIAEFLVDAPLPVRFTHATEQALVEALENLSHDVPISLALNPVDLLNLQESGMLEHIKDQFPSIRMDPQPTLKEGNWIVQTPRQAIRRVSDELLTNLRDRFGLLDSVQRDLELNATSGQQDDRSLPPVMNVAVTTSSIPQPGLLGLASTMAYSLSSSTAIDAPDEYLDLPEASISSTRTK
jgi:flagellar assembly protein FliH